MVPGALHKPLALPGTSRKLPDRSRGIFLSIGGATAGVQSCFGWVPAQDPGLLLATNRHQRLVW